MLYAFFIFGGFWFWSLVAVEILFLGYFVYEERGYPSTAALVIFALLILGFGDATILPYIRDNPKAIGIGLSIYFVGAVVFSIIKFYLKLKDIKRRYLRDGYEHAVPQFYDLFSKVAFWMAYWPICLFWSIATDFIVRFFKGLADSISGIFKKMYYSVLGEVLADIKKKKDSKGNLKGGGSFET
jgi:hypothetical protein